MSENKAIILLGDGMGDRPVPSLDGKTPLEAQNTPALDRIAEGGVCGLLNPISPGIRIGSDTAHMAILGYDPFTLYKGRGPFEAKGVGIDVRPGDVAFRCNFATVENGMVVDRRAGRIKEGTDQLARALSKATAGGIDGAEIIFLPSVEHRAALVIRGEHLDHHVTEVDPHHEGAAVPLCVPCPGYEKDANAIHTAKIVNEFVRIAHEVFEAHPINKARREQGLPPANAALPRGVGTAPHLEPFSQKYGLNGVMIVEVDLIKGLGLYLNMDIVEPAGATGGADTDEMSIARAVVEAWSDHDFILCNIKSTDLGGHDGDVKAKMEAVAKVDRAAGYLLDHLDWSHTVIAVSADHCTPITFKDHTGDGIAIAFYGTGVRPDAVTQYGERPCARGDLGNIRGVDVMNLLTNYTGTQEKFGA